MQKKNQASDGRRARRERIEKERKKTRRRLSHAATTHSLDATHGMLGPNEIALEIILYPQTIYQLSTLHITYSTHPLFPESRRKDACCRAWEVKIPYHEGTVLHSRPLEVCIWDDGCLAV
jgi:hypothetical protein